MSASILVVHDEPDVADLFRQRFRRESRQGKYVMPFCRLGPEALDRLGEQIQPTLAAVLSDINMPGMDGLELLAWRDQTASPWPRLAHSETAASRRRFRKNSTPHTTTLGISATDPSARARRVCPP
jgi:CheY-like chemotaxis protein